MTFAARPSPSPQLARSGVVTERRDSTPVSFSQTERRHLIEDVIFEAEQTVVHARGGPWSHLPDGRAGAGSLGVLVDNALGYDAGRWADPQGWLVTREIRMDYLADVPIDGQLLTAVGRAEPPRGLAGFGAGEVLDASGRVIAVTTDWVRYGSPFPLKFTNVESGSRSAGLAPGVPNGPGGPGCAVDALDAVSGTWSPTVAPTEQSGLVVSVTPDVMNEAGSFHGGAAFAASVLTAELELAHSRPDARVTSAHVVHVGAGDPGETITFTAEVPHLGRSAQLLRVTGVDSAGRVIVMATITSQS